VEEFNERQVWPMSVKIHATAMRSKGIPLIKTKRTALDLRRQPHRKSGVFVRLPEKAISGKTIRSRFSGFARLKTLSALVKLLLTSPTWGLN